MVIFPAAPEFVTDLLTARIKVQRNRSLRSILHNIVLRAKRFIPAFAMFACGDQMMDTRCWHRKQGHTQYLVDVIANSGV